MLTLGTIDFTSQLFRKVNYYWLVKSIIPKVNILQHKLELCPFPRLFVWNLNWNLWKWKQRESLNACKEEERLYPRGQGAQCLPSGRSSVLPSAQPCNFKLHIAHARLTAFDNTRIVKCFNCSLLGHSDEFCQKNPAVLAVLKAMIFETVLSLKMILLNSAVLCANVQSTLILS